jgi:hypothetical protein
MLKKFSYSKGQALLPEGSKTIDLIIDLRAKIVAYPTVFVMKKVRFLRELPMRGKVRIG